MLLYHANKSLWVSVGLLWADVRNVSVFAWFELTAEESTPGVKVRGESQGEFQPVGAARSKLNSPICPRGLPSLPFHQPKVAAVSS